MSLYENVSIAFWDTESLYDPVKMSIDKKNIAYENYSDFPKVHVRNIMNEKHSGATFLMKADLSHIVYC